MRIAAKEFTAMDPSVPYVMDPVGDWTNFENDGTISLVCSYEVNADGRSHSDERASISDVRSAMVDRATHVSVEVMGSYSGIEIALNYDEPGGTLRVSMYSMTEAERVLDTLTTKFPPLPTNYYGKVEIDSEVSAPRVFIGHGGDNQWEVVREWVLAAGYRVEVFEADERAGFSTLQEVLGMIRASQVALIVMTSVDELADHTKQARQNVVHELGLCQGMLGFESTVVLLENGTSSPSNIDGHIQIRFDRGELHRSKDRILAALNRRLGVGV